MDATPYLVEIADALEKTGLEAILIGNAAAALQGAPVTTVDFDFFYRASKANEAKLHELAQLLGATLTQPFPTVSKLYRLQRAHPELQLDFASQIHGARSFNSLRSRATSITIEQRTILIATLADIIKSKREANRPRDRAVLDVLEKTLAETESQTPHTGPNPGGDA